MIKFSIALIEVTNTIAIVNIEIKNSIAIFNFIFKGCNQTYINEENDKIVIKSPISYDYKTFCYYK